MKTPPPRTIRERTVRDRDAAPTAAQEKAKPEVSPKVRKACLDALRRSEEARIHKNAEAKKEKAAYDELEALMKEHKLTASGLAGTVEIDGESYDATATFQAKQKKVLDLSKLERLVDKKTWRKCLVAQVGLVEQHAGKNVLAQATSYQPAGIDLEIKIAKRKK